MVERGAVGDGSGLDITLHVNGERLPLEVVPSDLLLDVLRTRAGVKSPKIGCERGDCGSCTILLDGRSVRSCLILAVEADGLEVTTVEGIGLEPYEMDVVVARIEGASRSDEELVLSAHLDHPKESANDNAAGVATMLSLARFFAEDDRRVKLQRNLLFVGTSAHHEFSDGSKAFIAAHPDILEKTLLVVNIEHPSSIASYYRGALNLGRVTVPGQLVEDAHANQVRVRRDTACDHRQSRGHIGFKTEFYSLLDGLVLQLAVVLE